MANERRHSSESRSGSGHLRFLFNLVSFASVGLLMGSCFDNQPDDPFLLAPDTPVVLVLIDTLRADHLSCYGYPLETSPHLDELASRSFLFEANSTQCNATFPSITSVFTGVYPKTHRNYLAVPIKGMASESGPYPCASERFGERGYYTAAVTSHPSWGAERDLDATLWRGWDEISHLGPPIPIEERALHARASNTNGRLFEVMDVYDRDFSDQPLFIWAHYFDPHTDLWGNLYDPPEDLANSFFDHHFEQLGLSSYADELRDLDPTLRNEWIQDNTKDDLRFRLKLAAGRAGYDAEILSCDQGIAQLFERLEESGILDEAIIVVMSDHGENMEENSEERSAYAFTHKRLYDGVSHTPLLIHLPGQVEGRRIPSITQNIDVLPTLMEILDFPLDESIEGRSLVPLMRGDADELHERVFIESSTGSEKAVRSDELKLIDGWMPNQVEVYEWRDDPGEVRDLSESGPKESITELVEAMDQFRPDVVLRIHAEPMKVPYDLQMQVQMPGVSIKALEGAPESALSDDRGTFTWSGKVGPEGLDVVLHPQVYEPGHEVHWRIRHSGRDNLPLAVRLGKTPVSSTPAIPVWTSVAGALPAPDSFDYKIEEDLQTGLKTIDIRHPGARKIECEVRYSLPRMDKFLEAQRMDGLSERRPTSSHFHRSDAFDVDEARLELLASHPKAGLRYLLRIDGSWPDPEKLSINGKPIDTRLLHFVFPSIPMDKRIQPYLSAGPAAGTKLPPGTIQIWQESGGDGGEIDASHLPAGLADQLNSIGYLGDAEQEDE